MNLNKQEALRRKQAAERSRERGSRAANPGIVAITSCDHVWGVGGYCLRCEEEIHSQDESQQAPPAS